MQHRAAAAAAMVLGTLLAATIVANQGNDNYDAAGRWAMAEAGSREDGQVSNRDVARESPEAMQTVDDNGNIIGYRGTPGSSDPYAYIRTGYYPKILAREAEVQRESASGHFSTVHLGLDRWQEANGVAPGKNGGEKAKDAHALPSWLQDTALKTAASNVATQSWPGVQEPFARASNPIAAAGPSQKSLRNFFANEAQ